MYAFNLCLATLILSYAIFSVGGVECIYDDSGQCIAPCPPDTYSYAPGCGRDTLSQRTCRTPVARSIGKYCDFSRCDCSEPKVWDEKAKKCVAIEDCSPQTQDIGDNDGRI